MARFLNFYLSRVTAGSVGGDRLRQVGELTGTSMASPLAAGAELVRLAPEQRARAGIEVAAVGEEVFGSRLRAVGQVGRAPGSTLIVKAIAGGRIESLAAAPGERVQRGDVVVVLHSHALLTLQSELLMAVDQVRVAEQRLAAGRELLAIEGISRLDLERREQDALSARLRSSSTREELLDHGYPEPALERVLSSQQLDPHLPVASPVDGVVLEVMVQEQAVTATEGAVKNVLDSFGLENSPPQLLVHRYR